MELVASRLRRLFEDPDRVTFTILSRSWPTDLWPFHGPLSYLGKDGGGGLGSGPGLSVGAAVALADMGRYAVSVIGDGDFCMGATALWTAARHRVPLLMLVDNNRTYFNDELHQETVAKMRGRNEKNRWIGLRMEDPRPDIAGLARAQGAVGIGPVTKSDQVEAALKQGVSVLKQGGLCVIDLHIDPSDERKSSASIGQRKT
jgi:thiamine pyrophosphate-dependent acetolactate synthase large subunit-like protein